MTKNISTCYDLTMEFTLDPNDSQFMITTVAPGEIKVNNNTFNESLIITANNIIPKWPVNHLDELNITHLETLLTLNPKLVILGCGERHQLLDASITAWFLSRGIGIECMETTAACRTFNVLMSEGREAIAALII